MKSTKARLMTLALGLSALLAGLTACANNAAANLNDPTLAVGEDGTVDKKIEIIGQTSIVEGEEATFGVKFEGVVAGRDGVVWTSSDEEVLTVTNAGKATAVAAGSATLTATLDGASATFDVTVISRDTLSFNVRFLNYDGTLLYQTKIKYGEKATYVGKDPERTADYKTIYTFTGWDKDPAETTITADTTFTAQYGESDGFGFIFNRINQRECQLTSFIGDPADFGGALTIPASYGGKPVTAIGSYAFYQTAGLEHVIVPEGVTATGYGAFFGCTDLKSVTLPDSLYDLGSSNFYGCTSLTDVKLPAHLDRLPSQTFQGCTALMDIDLPDEMNAIGPSAFSGCAFETITIPESVVTIEGYAFGGNSALKSIDIPESVTSIGTLDSGSAFRDCTSLETVTGMENVTTIGQYAFYECQKLASLPVPFTQFETIGENAFWRTALTEVTLADDMFIYDVNAVVEGDGRSSRRGLASGAFSYCGSLAKVTYGKNMVAVPSSTFGSCHLLNETNVSGFDSVEEIGSAAFRHCGFVNLDMTTLFPSLVTISDSHVFGNNHITVDGKTVYTLKTVKISNTVASIGDRAFIGSGSLETVEFESGNENIIELGESVFSECTSLKSIDFGDASIGNFALTIFSGCTALESYSVPVNVADQYATDEQGALYNGDKSVFYSYPAAASGTTFTMPDTVKTIDNSTSSVGTAFASAKNLTEITLNEGLTGIYRQGAFEYCTSLTSITFPASLTYFATYNQNGREDVKAANLCRGATSLKEVTFLGESINIVPGSAFSGCTALEKVTLAKGQVEIKASAFNNMSANNNTASKLTELHMTPKSDSDYPTVANGAFCQSTSGNSTRFADLTIYWHGKHTTWTAGDFHTDDYSSYPAFELNTKVVCDDGYTVTLTGVSRRQISYGPPKWAFTYTWSSALTEAAGE